MKTAFHNISSTYLSQKGTRTKALVALGLVGFFWGTTWVASKEGVKHMPALQMAAIRQITGGLAYVAFFAWKGKSFPRGKEWTPVIVLSILNFMLSNALTTWGVKYISAGLGAIIAAIFPLWIVIIEWFASGTKLTSKAMAGLFLGFLGICVIFYEHLYDFLNPDFRFGILLSVIATWSWAFGTLYTKKQAIKFNPYFNIGLQMVISGLTLYSVAYGTGMIMPLNDIPVESWIAIGYLLVFGSVIAYTAYLYALQHLPTGLVSVYAYMNPVVAVVIAALFFDEKLTVYIAAGGALTLTGVYLVNESYRRV